MPESVLLTKEDMEVLFDRWNKEAVEKGWDQNPFDEKKQADHFFSIAKQYEEERG